MTGSTPAILALLASSSCWAALDVQRKKLAVAADPMVLGAVLALLGLPAFALVGAFRPEPGFDAASYLPRTVAAAAISSVAQVAFLRALSLAPLSTCLPLLALTPVFAASFGALWLGDAVTPSQAAGVALIAIGAWVLPHGHSESCSVENASRGRRLMLLVGLSWGLASVLDRDALRFASAIRHAAVQCGLVGGLLIAASLAFGRLQRWRSVISQPILLLLAGATGSVGLGFQYFALHGLDAGTVESVKRALGLILSLINGRLLFGEAISIRHLAAAALLAAGVPLVLKAF